MTTYLVKTFGGVALANAVATLELSTTVRSRSASPISRGGRYSVGGLFDALNLTLNGTVSAADMAGLRTAWDAVAAMFAPGQPQALYIDSDRYCMAEVVSELRIDPWKGLPSRKYSIGLAAYDDPPWWADTVSTQALAVGATTFDAEGTGAADAIITIVVSAAPAGSLVTITDASGAVFSLAPDAAATFVADSYAEEVMSGGVDKTALIGTSQFLRLGHEANTLTVALSGGATISSASVSWRDRWY